ncbi:MAG: cell wall-binding repeat-containing protein [Lachnospiraceae bacterium]|nr:cell wall-binding repeat-containing protein [Lachnospiraceae bacterium]
MFRKKLLAVLVAACCALSAPLSLMTVFAENGTATETTDVEPADELTEDLTEAVGDEASDVLMRADEEGSVSFVFNDRDFQNALDFIKRSPLRNHEIALLGDVGSSENFDAPACVFDQDYNITITGHGHTIYAKDTWLTVKNGANVTLGDGQSELTIKGTYYKDNPGLITVEKDSTLNMQDKVTIRDNQIENSSGGAVAVSGGTFNMTGGSIINCGIVYGKVSYGGGVLVTNSGLFNMSGGQIKDCFALTKEPYSDDAMPPASAGAGVFVGGASTFNMTGGKIDNCTTTESGAGVFVVASTDAYYAHEAWGHLDSRFSMTGGEIINCSGGINGGGVGVFGFYVPSVAQTPDPQAPGFPSEPGIFMTGGSVTNNTALHGGGICFKRLDESVPAIATNVICNNTTGYFASDVYAKDAKLVLADPSTWNKTYNKTNPGDIAGELIEGWFEDGEAAPFYRSTVNTRKQVTSLTLDSEIIALTAARKDLPSYTVSFDLQGHGTAIDAQTLKKYSKATQPAVPVEEGYVFGGWYTDAACTAGHEYDFTSNVTAETTLYAKWIEMFGLKRLGGDNRYGTVAKVAAEAFPTGADEIILINGAKFPDALSASGYAGAKNCPLLLTSLKELKPEIKNLLTNTWQGRVKTVTIIGGGFESAVLEALQKCGVENIRTIAGKDRFETAEILARVGLQEGLYTTDACVVATGATAADALSISPWSYKYHMPLLLAGKSTKSLTSAGQALVQQFDKVFVVGSEKILNDPVVAGMPNVERLAGDDRYATSLKIAERFADPETCLTLTFAAGGNNNFPDALGGAMLAGYYDSPMILVSMKEPNNKNTYQYVSDTFGDTGNRVYVLGSNVVLTDKTANTLADIVKAKAQN